MKTVLLALFPRPSSARRARVRLRELGLEDGDGQPTPLRVHEGELDVMLGADLAGTRAQTERELRVTTPFLLIFASCALVGATVDLSGWLGDTAPAATAALGSIGVLLGTAWILLAQPDALDRALVEAERSMEGGAALLTLAVDEADGPRAEAEVARLGGSTLFRA